MIRSSLVKSACVAIALLGFSAPQAGAIEIQGSNPAASLSDGLISKAFIAHRGATAVGPRGGVYHRGGTAVGGYHGGAYRGGVYRGGAYGYHGGALSRRRYPAAGLGPAGIAGDRAARSRPARRWACSLQERPLLTRAAASAGPVLVLHRPKLSAGLLGRLPVIFRVLSDLLYKLGRPLRRAAISFCASWFAQRKARLFAMDPTHKVTSADMMGVGGISL